MTAAPVDATPGRMHRRLQLEAMEQGQHALSLALKTPIRLHEAAAQLDGKPNTRGRRCGNCRFRKLINTGTTMYPKCLYGGPEFPRVTAEAGSDLKRWWPACTEHEPAK